MLYMEIIPGCRGTHKKDRNALYGQNSEFCILSLLINKVVSKLQNINNL